MTVDCVVIGAGLAGLSAAVRLADAGLCVVVLEEGPRLGGRATAFTDRETGERVDNGQHVLFGCYRETYAYLKRIGTADLAPLQPRLALTMADLEGRTAALKCPAISPPWHLVAAILRWPALTVRDRFSALKLRTFLASVRRDGAEAAAARVPASQTVSDWLDAHGQSPRLRDWLWDPLAIAALNQSPDVAGAAPFVRVVGELFGPRLEDAAVGLPAVPLDTLFAEPARLALEAVGSAIRPRTSGRVVVDDAGRVVGVRAGAETIACTQVVSAVPWHAFGRIWETGVPRAMEMVAANAAATAGSPIVTVNLWFDGSVMPGPFVGLVGGPMHWVFDKSAIFGEQAGHLSIVASGADDLAAMDNAAVTQAAVEHLARALPLSRTRTLKRSVVVREHRATFSLAPAAPPRPATVSALSGFYLAGDWTDTGLPGTIEGAILSGHRAADAVIKSRNI